MRLARTDDLTGLANRRALIDDLANALSTGRPPALLILDLDGFKTINDTHGHHAGDVAVRASVGFAVRAGGEVTPADLLHRADLTMYQAKRDAGTT